MKIVIFTANSTRHMFVANTLARAAGDSLVISECLYSEELSAGTSQPEFERHFRARSEAEMCFFPGTEYFISKTIPVVKGGASFPGTLEAVQRFDPEMGFVFGSSLLPEPVLSLIPRGRFVNLHLGLSPYYRGSGTNFWPFVNGEPGYVGSTLLHIDPGVDTGDIIAHVRPRLKADDDVHAAGNRVIKESALALVELLRRVEAGGKLKRIRQWKEPAARVYRKSDFTIDALKQCHRNLKNGLIGKYLENRNKEKIRLIEL